MSYASIVTQARQHGYQSAEILDELARQDARVAGIARAAREAGYGDDDILGELQAQEDVQRQYDLAPVQERLTQIQEKEGRKRGLGAVAQTMQAFAAPPATPAQRARSHQETKQGLAGMASGAAFGIPARAGLISKPTMESQKFKEGVTWGKFLQFAALSAPTSWTAASRAGLYVDPLLGLAGRGVRAIPGLGRAGMLLERSASPLAAAARGGLRGPIASPLARAITEGGLGAGVSGLEAAGQGKDVRGILKAAGTGGALIGAIPLAGPALRGGFRAARGALPLGVRESLSFWPEVAGSYLGPQIEALSGRVGAKAAQRARLAAETQRAYETMEMGDVEEGIVQAALGKGIRVQSEGQQKAIVAQVQGVIAEARAAGRPLTRADEARLRAVVEGQAENILVRSKDVPAAEIMQLANRAREEARKALQSTVAEMRSLRISIGRSAREEARVQGRGDLLGRRGAAAPAPTERESLLEGLPPSSPHTVRARLLTEQARLLRAEADQAQVAALLREAADARRSLPRLIASASPAEAAQLREDLQSLTDLEKEIRSTLLARARAEGALGATRRLTAPERGQLTRAIGGIEAELGSLRAPTQAEQAVDYTFLDELDSLVAGTRPGGARRVKKTLPDGTIELRQESWPPGERSGATLTPLTKDRYGRWVPDPRRRPEPALGTDEMEEEAARALGRSGEVGRTEQRDAFLARISDLVRRAGGAGRHFGRQNARGEWEVVHTWGEITAGLPITHSELKAAARQLRHDLYAARQTPQDRNLTMALTRRLEAAQRQAERVAGPVRAVQAQMAKLEETLDSLRALRPELRAGVQALARETRPLSEQAAQAIREGRAGILPRGRAAVLIRRAEAAETRARQAAEQGLAAEHQVGQRGAQLRAQREAMEARLGALKEQQKGLGWAATERGRERRMPLTPGQIEAVKGVAVERVWAEAEQAGWHPRAIAMLKEVSGSVGEAEDLLGRDLVATGLLSQQAAKQWEGIHLRRIVPFYRGQNLEQVIGELEKMAAKHPGEGGEELIARLVETHARARAGARLRPMGRAPETIPSAIFQPRRVAAPQLPEWTFAQEVPFLERHRQGALLAARASARARTQARLAQEFAITPEAFETLSKTAPQSAMRYRPLPPDRTWGALAGQYVEEHIFNLLTDWRHLPTTSERVMAWFKAFKVPLSWAASIHNAGGNKLMAMIEYGIGPFLGGNYGAAIDELRHGTGLWAQARPLYPLGGGLWQRAEVGAALHELGSAFARDGQRGLFQRLEGRLRAGTMKLSSGYSAMEMLDKWACARWDHRARGTPLAEAMRRADHALINYAQVPSWVLKLRRSPLGAPFITFPYAVATKLLPHWAQEHPGKLYAMYRTPHLITGALNRSPEGRDRIALEEAVMPEWYAPELMIRIGSDRDGAGLWVDLSRFLPFSDIAEATLISGGKAGGELAGGGMPSAAPLLEIPGGMTGPGLSALLSGGVGLRTGQTQAGIRDAGLYAAALGGVEKIGQVVLPGVVWDAIRVLRTPGPSQQHPGRRGRLLELIRAAGVPIVRVRPGVEYPRALDRWSAELATAVQMQLKHPAERWYWHRKEQTAAQHLETLMRLPRPTDLTPLPDEEVQQWQAALGAGR